MKRRPTEQPKEVLYCDAFEDRQTMRDKALKAALYVKLREEEEERHYEVRYVRDPEDPTLWRRKRIRELSAREKAKRKSKQ